MKKLILVLIGALCVTAFAQPGGGKSFEKRSAQMAEKLQLTEQQQQGFDAILKNHHEQMRQLKGERRDMNREDRKAQREEDKANKDAKYQQLRAELSGILNADQLAKFDEIHAERRARHEKRRMEKHEHKHDKEVESM